MRWYYWNNINIATGMSQYQATIEAAVQRLNPVVNAAATTVLGMIPLLGDVFLTDLAQENLEPVLGSLLGSITSFAGSSATQAGMNYLFLRRIGKSMKSRLRPLQ